jgi:hypothetical protein
VDPFWPRGRGRLFIARLVGSGGKADCVAGANRVIFCQSEMQDEQFIVDALLACSISSTMEIQKL